MSESFQREYLLDRLTEQMREREGELQAGIVFLFLDRVDGLTRDVDALGQLGLSPTPFSAQDVKAISHW